MICYVFCRICLAVVAMFAMTHVAAESPDSIAELPKPDTIPAYLVPGGVGEAELEGVQLPSTIEEQREIALPPNLNTGSVLPSFSLTDLNTLSLFSWQNGGITCVGNSIVMPGIMGIEHGALNLRQDIGNLSITLWGGATKYGYFRGLQTSLGFGGSLDYRISDQWSMTIFGEYHSPLLAPTPGIGGNMQTPRFGGYVSYDINSHWGVSVGAQTQRSVFTNSWEAQPIVMPYYRINKDVKLGIDVGGIMYHIVRDWANGRKGVVGSPTIGPPRQGPPPVAPRR